MSFLDSCYEIIRVLF